ncbi:MULTISPECIES: arginine deiminase [Listeria]|uniref:arginine deiminase n=1 Tax=Listeria TaxID=1637 RepID=UPI001FC9094F|nr:MULTISPECIES: arginine deiminase [Listeria]
MKMKLGINSEIGTLKQVVVKRPGRELENLTPQFLHELLFDDIPFLPAIQKEHDFFVNVLRENGAEVFYLENLLEEAILASDTRAIFIRDTVKEAGQFGENAQHLESFLNDFETAELIQKVMTGLRKTEVPKRRLARLDEMLEHRDPFYLAPLPNLYFTRDPAAVIGNGLSINQMSQPARKRESYFMKFIATHHPAFFKKNAPIWFDRDNRYALEGGDEIVLSEKALAVGISERTDPRAIQMLATNLFQKHQGIRQVIAFELPKERAFMHLDTVFTMVAKNQFIVHPSVISSELKLFIMEWDKRLADIKITTSSNIKAVLSEALNEPEIDLIPCGGSDPINSDREQWNDGANTLAIKPGEVVTYNRNQVSNELLKRHGIKVHEIISSELSRGRGGPRCMTMPLYRT